MSEHRNPDMLKKKLALEKEIKEKKLAEQFNPEKAEESKQLGNEAYKKGKYIYSF